RPDAGEVVEAAAADLRPPLHVDRTVQLAELEVVPRLEALRSEVAWDADLLEQGEVVLAARRHPLLDVVADGTEGGLQLPLRLLRHGLELLDAGRHRRALVAQRVGLRLQRGQLRGVIPGLLGLLQAPHDRPELLARRLLL